MAEARAPVVVEPRQRHAVAEPHHPHDHGAEPGPRIEPGMERAQCRRLRRELNEVEGGAEEGAAAGDRDGHPLNHLIGEAPSERRRRSVEGSWC